MTLAYLFTSSLSKVWRYAATRFAIYVTNRLPRPPPKSLIETYSGKAWGMSRGFTLSDACVATMFRSL